MSSFLTRRPIVPETDVGRGIRLPLFEILAMVAVTAWLSSFAQAASHPLTIDDVLNLTHVDRATLSPDGEWAAVVIQRPAQAGEVYGRTAYEIDPARSDVWLVSPRTRQLRNLTEGKKAAAGFWCATWSPDGTKLAMLSTRPEGSEPRGGDNVRLYIWDRTTGALRRLTGAAIMTQTRYGSPLYQLDLRGGAVGGEATHRCSGEENAPFLWLNNAQLLAVALPAGEVSGLIDEFARPERLSEETLTALRGGVEPTATAVGSGDERLPLDRRLGDATLLKIDVASGAAAAISTLPAYPFRGELTLDVSPGGEQVAILATLGAIPPTRYQHVPYNDETWSVERRLGFVATAPGSAVRWTTMPAESRYPLELFGWSPDGQKVALRGRRDLGARATPLLIASSVDLSVQRLGPDAISVGGPTAARTYSRESAVFWVDDRSLLARIDGRDAASEQRTDWWLLTPDTDAINLTTGESGPPTTVRRLGDGSLLAVADGKILKFDNRTRKFVPGPPIRLDATSSIVWPEAPGDATSAFVVAAEAAIGRRAYQLIAFGASGVSERRFTLPHGAEVLDVDPARKFVLTSEPSRSGLHLRKIALTDGDQRDLLSLDTHLGAVDWGRTMLIDYRGEDGQALKAAVILPPGYQKGLRYPVITWVYPGYQVRSLNSYWLDPYLPGIYNLQLYAARGYVVLIPSMPPTLAARKRGDLSDFLKGALPAVDRLTALGIADPARLGVMGQSFGGFGTYALVTQTNRFKAAVAIAGDTDLAGVYAQFDSAARGYPGIEHEKSDNWLIAEVGQADLGRAPYEDYSSYWRNSPLAYVDRVETPLLLIHGQYDKRAPMSQAESFFFSLYRQGKTARLLRYWGESHALHQSPANVRSIYRESVAWFDKYLCVQAPPTSSVSTKTPFNN